MRLRKRHLLAAAALGSIAVALPAIASSVTPTISAYNEPGIYGAHYWNPATATITTGEAVKFANPYSSTYHGLKFTGGTAGATPSCTGIPQAAGEPGGAFHWEGECTFSKAGTYTFICTVHPKEMTGTITVKNAGEPVAITGAAASVTEHEATLTGTVNPEGNATEYFFKWGTTASYEQETSPQPVGEGTTNIPASAMLKGLAPGTLYHFQLVAKNSSGTVSGADQTFTTTSPPPPPGPPTATTSAATAVTETGATLNGTVNPDGRPTEYFFEWGTSETYGQATAAAPAGEDHAGHVASATLMALSPGTVYHFRLVAKNASETVSGTDQMFTTRSSPPPSPAPSNPPPPTVTPSSTTPAPAIAAIEPLSGSPLVGGPSLRSSQHGAAVHGTLEVSQAGAGGRLEVDLLANSASLAKAKHSVKVRVGRLSRSSLKAGAVSFAVPLTAKAKSALRRHRRLALTVRIVLTPPHGTAVTMTKSVVLHG
jgi:plastocyanin